LDRNRLIRSKKLQTLTDAQILKRYGNEPKGEEQHFLEIEIEQRDLRDQADNASRHQQKSRRHSALYYLFYVFLFAMFLGRFGSELFRW
jgi:hypothetical protein